MTTKWHMLWLAAALVHCGGGGSPADLAQTPADLAVPVPFACGTSTCAGDEVCVAFIAGAPPDLTPSDLGPSAPNDRCRKVPSACVHDKSCACLDHHGGSAQFCQQAFGAGLCYGAGENALTCGTS